MRIAFDTEFNCTDNKTIDLISIALVTETGQEYYAVSTEFDLSRCSDWLHENVLLQLPKIDSGKQIVERGGYKIPDPARFWKPREQIRSDIRGMINQSRPANGKVELYAYFASYDFVALCELFGGMFELPDGCPQYVMDLRQRMTDLSLTKDQLPATPKNQHDALADARWVMECLKFLDNK